MELPPAFGRPGRHKVGPYITGNIVPRRTWPQKHRSPQRDVH
jgi:hypothetical protein